MLRHSGIGFLLNILYILHRNIQKVVHLIHNVVHKCRKNEYLGKNQSYQNSCKKIKMHKKELLDLCNVLLLINIHFVTARAYQNAKHCDIVLTSMMRQHAASKGSELSMSDQKNKFKEALERFRSRQTSEENKTLWKIRLAILAPFIIAAIIFLLLSLD